MPFNTVPELIKFIAVDLAVYSLYTRRLHGELPDDVKDRYKVATKQLQRLQAGDMVLELSPGGNDAGSEYRSNKTSDDREFNRKLWDLY